MKLTLTETDIKALRLLKEPLTCTELGEQMWTGARQNSPRQTYARPAGKVIQRLKRAKLVRCTSRDRDRRVAWVQVKDPWFDVTKLKV